MLAVKHFLFLLPKTGVLRQKLPVFSRVGRTRNCFIADLLQSTEVGWLVIAAVLFILNC
jgi:hypothetical protein